MEYIIIQGVTNMHSLDCRLNQPNHSDFATDSTSNAYNLLILLTGLAIVTYALARLAESNNRLNLDNRFARILAGLLVFIANTLHTKKDDLEIVNPEKTLIAIGPHRTGWEAIVVASKITGTAPRFFATDAYNSIPGVSSFLKLFKVIPVQSDRKKDNGRSANAKALEDASKILNENGCVAMFPQGNFSRLGQESPRIYPGVANLALSNKIPIQVIRLDGFFSLQNPIIPLFIRNSATYRSFLSALHLNNVSVKLCCEIDFHLKSENKHLSEEKKIEAICAQLYAYYRRTEELTDEEVESIKTEIADGTHILIWRNKVQQDDLKKQLTNAKVEGDKLEATTFASMSLIK